jgi:hypothetical protein
MRYNHTPFAAPEHSARREKKKKKLTRKKHQFVHNELETDRKKKKEKEFRHTVRKTHTRAIQPKEQLLRWRISNVEK